MTDNILQEADRIKAIAVNTEGTPAQKLLAILAAAGVEKAADLAAIMGVTERYIRSARKPSSGTRVPENGSRVPEAEFRERKQNSEKRNQSSAEVSPIPPSKNNNTTLESLSSLTPREGETHAGHGVFVNCETVRHASFTISLPAIRMGTLAAGLDADLIKTQCVAHALQWAAEIEGGKPASRVLPDKIANFLASSIMGAANRQACQETRIAKAAAASTKPRTASEVLAAKYAQAGAA